MMKLSIKIFILSIVMQSCNAQSDFDLTQIKLQKDKISDVIATDVKRTVRPGGGGIDLEYLSIKDPKFLRFHGADLRGQQNPDNNNYGLNGITVYYNKQDSIIFRYDIYIYSEKQAKDLLSALREKLGEPNFTGFRKPEDKTKNKFRTIVWEDLKKQELYFFEYTLDETIKGQLKVIHNFKDINRLNILGFFSEWEDYLYVRQQKGNINYTYQDFLKDENEKDPSNSYNMITK